MWNSMTDTIMKKTAIIIAAAACAALTLSCQKSAFNARENGTLSFEGFSISINEELETKAASAAGGNYVIIIKDAQDAQVERKNYSEIRDNGNKLSLPAGSYTLEARSSSEEIPAAAFEQPVYGVSKAFVIEAGQTTSLGELVCTLLQCKVTVSYSDEFLASVTGEGRTRVSLTSGSPLDFVLNADGSYEQSAGYFAVSGSTMEVEFSGSIDGKNQKMIRSFTGIAPRQWRQIKFIQKKNEEGNATFDIVINDLISDDVLNNDISAGEDIIGSDPDAPAGDGGITLTPDYEAGCDADITDLTNIKIYPLSEKTMSIKLKAEVPGAVKRFTVDITSSSEAFLSALDAADARHIDLIHPAAAHDIIFQVVPFPHGEELLGQTLINFDLSAAQEAIVNYPGVHNFVMKIVDNDNCSKEIPVTMVVE